MSDSSVNDSPPPLLPRALLLIVWIGFAAAIAWFIWTHPVIHSLIRHPRSHAAEIRAWANARPITAPLIFIAVYIGLGSFALPVWWLAIVSGFAFGLMRGGALTQLSAMITAALAASFARYVFEPWLESYLAKHTQRLKDLHHSLGHNGLLVVAGVRLAHFIPAGLSNYAFGLARISLRNIVLGTLVGGLPSTLWFVAIGALPGSARGWEFLALLGGLNIICIAILLARYLRPEWFKGWGVE